MRRAALLLAAFALAALLAGCGATPFQPPMPDQIREGPGMLTGESGAYSLKRP
jgi:hypothetical protein